MRIDCLKTHAHHEEIESLSAQRFAGRLYPRCACLARQSAWNRPDSGKAATVHRQPCSSRWPLAVAGRHRPRRGSGRSSRSPCRLRPCRSSRDSILDRCRKCVYKVHVRPFCDICLPRPASNAFVDGSLLYKQGKNSSFCSDIISLLLVFCGEVAEWLKATVCENYKVTFCSLLLSLARCEFPMPVCV